MRDGWEVAKLGEVCLIQQGRRVDYKPIGEETFPVLGATGIIGTWKEASYDEPAVALGCRGTVGIPRLISEPSWFGNNVMALRPIDPDRLLLPFLACALEHCDLNSQGAIGGQVQKQITRKSLSPVMVPLPPLDEQRRIVDLIGAVDDAIEAAEAARAAVQEVTENMRDIDLWAKKSRAPLSELCTVDGSLVLPTGERASLPHVGTDRIVGGTGDLVGVVTATEDGVTSGKYKFDDRHVIYSKIRPNLRKVAVPEEPGLCSADAYPLLPSPGISRRYLQQVLLSRPFTESATSKSGRTKMPKINRAELMSLPVPVHEEVEIEEFTTRFDALIEARRALCVCADSLSGLRSNLLTALLSGEHEIPASYDELLEVTA